MTSAAIYARISEDDTGLERGVSRQMEDARQLAQQRGWQVVGEYTDNDVSAWNGDTRKAYQRLMADAEAGRFEQIVCYMTSRLWRNRVERGQAINRLGKLRIGVAAVRGPQLDLSQASGRMLADILGSMDTMESEQMSERVQRASLQRAQEGRSNGAVAYGWRREYRMDATGRLAGFHDVENAEEATIVREIVDRLLDRESAHALVKDLNARGVPAPSRRPGVRWNPTSLRFVALRPANVGLRLYKGQTFPADWNSIVNQDKHDRVVAMLEAPERKQSRDGKRKHLLSFAPFATCHCGAQLRVGSQKRAGGRRHQFYECTQFHTARSMQPVDDLVSQYVVAWMGRPEAARIFETDDTGAQEARERVLAIRARLDTAADSFAAGRIDGPQLDRITSALRPELVAAEAEAKRYRRSTLPATAEELLTDKAAARVWESLSVVQKRSIIEAIGVQVVLLPGAKSGPGFEPESVEFRTKVLANQPGFNA